MPDANAEDFYVGYAPKAPKRLARHTRIVVSIFVAATLAAATLIVASMRSPGEGVWEDGLPKSFAGVLVKRPYPMLLDREGRALLIVDFGKRGAQARLAAISEGQRLELTGYPLIRDGRTMIELAPEADAVRAGAPAAAPSIEWTGGQVTLRGEIVDSKCFLGAMKPGDGKTHKACAVRCISGGIPPMLVCWDGSGRTSYFLLSDEQGGPLGDWVLPLVGEGVEVTGSPGRIGDLGAIKVTSAGVKRLASGR